MKNNFLHATLVFVKFGHRRDIGTYFPSAISTQKLHNKAVTRLRNSNHISSPLHTHSAGAWYMMKRLEPSSDLPMVETSLLLDVTDNQISHSPATAALEASIWHEKEWHGFSPSTKKARTISWPQPTITSNKISCSRWTGFQQQGSNQQPQQQSHSDDTSSSSLMLKNWRNNAGTTVPSGSINNDDTTTTTTKIETTTPEATRAKMMYDVTGLSRELETVEETTTFQFCGRFPMIDWTFSDDDGDENDEQEKHETNNDGGHHDDHNQDDDSMKRKDKSKEDLQDNEKNSKVFGSHWGKFTSVPQF